MAPPERTGRRAGLLYIDTSALLKLLVREPESVALEREVLLWPQLATSVVTEVELPRAIARAREERPDAVVSGSVVLQMVLSSITIIELGPEIVGNSRAVAPVQVGSLDAIHVASALSLGRDLTAVATYDVRMQDALNRLGVDVVAPV